MEAVAPSPDGGGTSQPAREATVGRSLEEFELLNTGSQLRRAAEHAYAFYQGAISRDECQRVVQESHDLLATTARVRHHLVPLAEMWSIERLRHIAVLERRIAATTPEVLFVDRADATWAPLAAALLTRYARGRVQVSSAGLAPADAVDPAIVGVLAAAGIDMAQVFCKPVTDEAVLAADLVILLGPLTPAAAIMGKIAANRLLRWDIVPDEGSEEAIHAIRDELDRCVLRLLADLLTPAES
jgi:protein-tyrosine-phosphatase